MKKINHEKLTKRDKTAIRGHENDELPSIGSYADQKRYFESKGDNNHKERKPSPIVSNERPLPSTIVISDKNKERKEYNLEEKYQEGDLIKHPTFGKGTVLYIIDNQRMDVYFRNGRKILVMNKKAS